MLLSQGVLFVAPVIGIVAIIFGGYQGYKAYRKSETVNTIAGGIFVIAGLGMLYLSSITQ